MDLEIFHQVIIGLVCTLVIIDCGLNEGWPTPTLAKFGVDDPITLTSDQEALVINWLYMGVAIGSLSPILLMDRIGRKWTILIATIPKVLSWIALGLADSEISLYCGRGLAGIGCGIIYSVLPMYIGEISTKRTRGPLGTVYAVLLNTGILLIYVVGLQVSRFTMAMSCLVCPLLFSITFVWLPESAVYLTRKNRLGDAEKTLKWTLGKDNVDEEMEEIKRIVSAEDQIKKIGFFGSFKIGAKSPANRRAFWIQFILCNGLCLTGASAILTFQAHIFHEANFDAGSDYTIMATGVAVVISGIVCVGVVKTFGKRRLLLVAGPPFFGSLAVLAVFFTLQRYGVNMDSVNWIPSASVIVYVIVFGFAFNTVPLAYLGELFSTEVKVTAGVCAALYYALTTIVVVKVYQILFDAYGTYVPMWILSAIAFVIWCLVYLYVPETEGKSLSEIQTMLNEGFVKKKKKENSVKPQGTDAVDIGVYSLEKVSIVPTFNNSINLTSTKF